MHRALTDLLAMDMSVWEKAIRTIGVNLLMLVLANASLDWISARSPRFDRLLNGFAVTLVAGGRPDERRLRQLSISPHELDVAVHEQGADAIDDVRLAVLEPGGDQCWSRSARMPRARRRRISPTRSSSSRRTWIVGSMICTRRGTEEERTPVSARCRCATRS